MANFVTLTCPSCGAKLQVTSNLDTFACAHCGNELHVQRTGGTVALLPVMESLGRVESKIDLQTEEIRRLRLAGSASGMLRAASELAIPRVEREIADAHATLKTMQLPGLFWPTSWFLFGILGLFVALGNFADDPRFGLMMLLLYAVWSVLAWRWRKRRVMQRRRLEEIRTSLTDLIADKKAELGQHRKNVSNFV